MIASTRPTQTDTNTFTYKHIRLYTFFKQVQGIVFFGSAILSLINPYLYTFKLFLF